LSLHGKKIVMEKQHNFALYVRGLSCTIPFAERLPGVWLSVSVSMDMTFLKGVAMGQGFSPHPAAAHLVAIVTLRPVVDIY
jgi:hypothetical protein